MNQNFYFIYFFLCENSFNSNYVNIVVTQHNYVYGCYGYFFWEAEFNDKCKNQGYNENHICNISNFSKIHHQAERKKSLIKQI